MSISYGGIGCPAALPADVFPVVVPSASVMAGSVSNERLMGKEVEETAFRARRRLRVW